ncbi:hypothetical protein M5689_017573 [Euphorbia peplus]|nr:hypothetical protein M5689_017573 [Euphorbia peplus]
MAHYSSLNSLLLVGVLFLAFNISYSSGYKLKTKTSTFLSPKFELGPGSVENNYYLNIEFLRGHIAVKSFTGEVVDEAGNPIPLSETYLHHWVVRRYFHRKDSSNPQSDNISVRNSGICQGEVLGQYFGLGSETRKTATYVPDPYGIEIGNPDQIPKGFEEQWFLNVHAIDSRGVQDRRGCIECKCDLYNVTVNELGAPLSPNYKGGLTCCPNHAQCKLRKGFQGGKRSLYLRMTVAWIEWESSIIPVKIFIFDVTDDGKRSNNSADTRYGCKIEYDVEPCQANGMWPNACIDARKTNIVMPKGGYVIYGAAHQHAGGIGSTLYRQDGRVICKSVPTYGKGKEVGNEAGYIVGMSTCYPKPGSVKITDGEKLTLQSNYRKSTQMNIGVMGLFYLLVADKLPNHVQNSDVGHDNMSEYAYFIFHTSIFT